MPREESTLIRVYVTKDAVLFFENANSPTGTPIGVILQTDDDEWSFFPGRARGLTLVELQEVALKISRLNDNHKPHPNDTPTGTADADI